MVSIKEFGAYGDGMYDDSEALRNAILNSSRVYIPNGVYQLNSSIFSDGDIAEKLIEGESRAGVLLKCTEDFIRVNTATDLIIKNLTISGRNTGYWNGIYVDLSGSNVIIDNCVVTGFPSSNIWIVGVNNVVVNNCELSYSVNSTGLTLDNPGEHNKPLFARITGNYCHNNSLDGIAFYCGFVECIGNRCENNGESIRRAAGIYGNGAFNSLIEGNYCKGNTGNGIDFIKSTGMVYKRNRCVRNECSGVYVGNFQNGSKIEGNFLSENGSNGIDVQKYNLVVQGNGKMMIINNDIICGKYGQTSAGGYISNTNAWMEYNEVRGFDTELIRDNQ